MKVLVLFIYSSNNGFYDKMLEIQKRYIHSNENIECYFVTLDENLNDDIKLENDTIYVKGTESHINILYKTVKALDYLINTLNKNYDFVVRSNISTIINFNCLYEYLKQSPKTMFYAGGVNVYLRWPIELHDLSESRHHERNSFYGLQFVQGTSIILSCDVVQCILENKNTIEYDIVDDVKIALLIRELLNEAYTNFKNLKPELFATVRVNTFSNNCVFIRNSSQDRDNDADNMNIYVNNLYNL